MTRHFSISATASKALLRGLPALAVFALAAAFSASARAAAPPLPELLDRVGKQVEKFWNYFPYVTCTEKLTQTKLGDKGKVLFEQHETFDYLIFLKSSGQDITVDESRVEKSHAGSKGDESLLDTNGFSLFMLIFHPLYQSHYEFTAEPDETVGGRSYLVVSFHQVANDHPLSVLHVRDRDYPLAWSGKAWIDPVSFAVVRIQADLGDSMADMGLLRLDADVTYARIHFDPSVDYWLPVTAVVDAETKRQHWRNTHAFADYKRFTVDTAEKVLTPQSQ